MSGHYCDPMLAAFGDEEQQFLAHLTALDDVTVWVGKQGWLVGDEFRRPGGWQKLRSSGNEARLKAFEEYRDCLAMNTGLPLAVVDVDTRNGGDVEKVRALLAKLKVRIFAEIDTPGGGKHFYVHGHPDLPTVHSKAENPKLPGFPGVDIQSFGANVYLPGTARPKYDGRGYTVVSDELDQLPLLGEDDDGGALALAEWVAEQRAQSVKQKARRTPGGATEFEFDKCEPWTGTPPDKRQQKYLDVALADEAKKVAEAKDHRNDTLFEAALKLGSYIAGAGLDEKKVIATLEQAARAVGLVEWTGERQVKASIQSGLRDGKRNPRAVPPANEKHEGSGMDSGGKKPSGTITVTSVLASQVRSGVPQWVWRTHGKGRVMRSTLVLFGGRPSAGKSTAARWFASGYSTGTVDGCFIGRPQNVAYIVGEESLKYVVKPSLLAHGADMDRIHFPKVDIDGTEVRLQSVRDELALTEFLLDNRITVVFVDPIMSTIGAAVDIHRSNQTRAHVDPWVRIAEKTNGVVYGIVHLRKELGTDILAAVNGSSAFGEVARSVIAFAREESTGDRVLSQVKNSAGDIDLSMSYTIGPTTVQTDEGRADVGQFVLGDVSERRVGDLLRADAVREKLAPRSWQILEVVFSAGEPVNIGYVTEAMNRTPGMPEMDHDDVGKYLRRLVKERLLVKGRGLFDWPGRLAERLAEHGVSV